MLTVLTHLPSPELQSCELTFLKSAPININKAVKQHQNYCKMLKSCGAQIVTLDENLSLPDSVFVEDPIIVFDEVAILASMGVGSRRKECDVLESYFSSHRKIERISLPAKIEGGDVLKIGRHIYVGDSPRTNQLGIKALGNIIAPFGYEVHAVKVDGCLHLKTGCTALDEKTLLINPDWVDSNAFAGYKKIATFQDEPFGANILPVNNHICMNEAFPRTLDLVSSLGYNTIATDISEFVKAEAGLTCMSIPFKQFYPLS